MAKELLLPVERIERAILLIRGQKVMLDRDLAELYGVATKVLNQAVKRYAKRFPARFHVSINSAGDGELEVTNCDIQFRGQAGNLQASQHDEQFQIVFEALRQLMRPAADKPKGPIGFHTPGTGPAHAQVTQQKKRQ